MSDLRCFDDFIEDGVTGLRFDHRGADPADALAVQLARLIGSPEFLHQIAEAGRGMAENFRTSAIARRMLDDFTSLLARRARRRHSTMTPILVTGGAGYIGSHTCKALRAAGFDPISYDNLERGNPEAVKWGALEIGDLADGGRLREILTRFRPAAVVHFAALAYVGESNADPPLYYRNNVGGTGGAARRHARLRRRQHRVFLELRGLRRAGRRADRRRCTPRTGQSLWRHQDVLRADSARTAPRRLR